MIIIIIIILIISMLIIIVLSYEATLSPLWEKQPSAIASASPSLTVLSTLFNAVIINIITVNLVIIIMRQERH